MFSDIEKEMGILAKEISIDINGALDSLLGYTETELFRFELKSGRTLVVKLLKMQMHEPNYVFSIMADEYAVDEKWFKDLLHGMGWCLHEFPDDSERIWERYLKLKPEELQ